MIRSAPSIFTVSISLIFCACGDFEAGDDEVETGGPEGPMCPEGSKLPVIAPVDCDAWADQEWGQGQWSNYAGSSVAPWSGVGEPPWEDWSAIEPCTASRPTSGSHQETGVLPIHAVHLPGGRILMWEGRHDQHAWNFRTQSWEWYPLTSTAGNDCYTPEALEEEGLDGILALDLFCAGHVLDGEGNLVTAGGNLSGNSDQGSLCSHVLPRGAYVDGSGAIDPADGDLCPGDLADLVEPMSTPWLDSGQHEVPRWYPTLTTLADGSVLMTAGFQTNWPGPHMFERFDGEGWTWAGSSGTLPGYPFMFLTPAGNLLYAGSESQPNEVGEGALFVRDPETSLWSFDQGVSSPVRGGSAVMFEPGKVMKSGGGTRSACAETEGAPLGTTAVLDLTGPNMGFADTGFPMHHPRHFHTLTSLPDGRVLATGGNRCGNGASGTLDNSCFADATTFEACKPGAPNCVDVTEIPCSVKTDCPAWATCGSQAVVDCPSDSCTCNPLNNACYATKAAELWDPQTRRWCVMAEQSFERMYHSTALLMPDGRVMSSGNGRRQGLDDWETAEFFSPPYLLDGNPRPAMLAVNDAGPDEIATLGWGGTVSIVLDDATSFAAVGRVTLVRLGSVTHQFDMGQRFIDLGCMWATQDAAGRDVVQVYEPVDANTAPPGDYMLFVLSESGAPSVGQYVKVGG